MGKTKEIFMQLQEQQLNDYEYQQYINQQTEVKPIKQKQNDTSDKRNNK